MKFLTIALASLSCLGCSTLQPPEGQSAYGTTALTRFMWPEEYVALVKEDDPIKKLGFAGRYLSDDEEDSIRLMTHQPIKPLDIHGW